MPALPYVALLLFCFALILHDIDAGGRGRRPPPKGKCKGKCVKRSSLRWALMGNPADACGPEYGCVYGCCRHFPANMVRQRLHCVRGNCWFNNPTCMDPCVCVGPNGGWNAQNQHLPGTCHVG